MKKQDLQKIIREEIKKSLNENYRDTKENVAMSGMREATVKKDDLDKIGDFIMSSPQFEGLSTSKIKAAIKDMHDEWKAVASNYKSIEDYFDEIEETGGEEAFMESKKPSKSKKSLKEGYAWERSERKFGEPLPTLASVQKAYQSKQKMTEIGAFPIGPGKMKALKPNKVYSILDAGTDEWNTFMYLGEIGQGSTAGNPGDHMFSAADAPGVYVFVALSEEDLKTMIKEP